MNSALIENIRKYAQVAGAKRLLLFVLASLADDDGIVDASVQEIAAGAGTQARACQGVLRELASYGAIVVIKNGGRVTAGGRQNLYRVRRWDAESCMPYDDEDAEVVHKFAPDSFRSSIQILLRSLDQKSKGADLITPSELAEQMMAAGFDIGEQVAAERFGRMVQHYGVAKVQQAVRIASDKGKRSVAYVEGIVRNLPSTPINRMALPARSMRLEELVTQGEAAVEASMAEEGVEEMLDQVRGMTGRLGLRGTDMLSTMAARRAEITTRAQARLLLKLVELRGLDRVATLVAAWDQDGATRRFNLSIEAMADVCAPAWRSEGWDRE